MTEFNPAHVNAYAVAALRIREVLEAHGLSAVIEDSLAIRERQVCVGCLKRRLCTPTNIGGLCNECLTQA